MVEVLTLVAMQREVTIARLGSVLGLLDLTTLLASAVDSFVASWVPSALSVPHALLVLGLGDTVLALALAPLLVRADGRAATRAVALRGPVSVLQGLPLIAGFPRQRLEALAAASKRSERAAGATVIRDP